MAKAEYNYTVDSARASLVRQEDTIIFGLIERARFPLNSPTYNQSYTSIPQFRGTLLDFLVRDTEVIQAKVLFTSPSQFSSCIVFFLALQFIN